MLLLGLTLYSVVVTSLLAFSVRRNLEYMERLQEVSDAVLDSLDVLDEQHQKIDLKTKIEIFSDEPVIRDLVQDIVTAKNSVLSVARTLDGVLEQEDETERPD